MKNRSCQGSDNLAHGHADAAPCTARRSARDSAIVGAAAQTPEHLAFLAQQRQLKRRRRTPTGHAASRQGTDACRSGAMPPHAPEAVSPTQRQGARAESLACAYLQAQGFRVLARNLQARTGEIDIAGMDGPVLAFVEVRQRSTEQFGGAAASVGPRKQVRLPRLANRFLAGRIPPCRFDVVAVHPEGVQWLKHAFSTI